MKSGRLLLCLIIACSAESDAFRPAAADRSLVDAARREEARRNAVERSGIEERVIEGNGESLFRQGNVSVFTHVQDEPEKRPEAGEASENRSSLRRYRTALQKLDRKIQKGEARLKKLQDRLLELKRESLKLGDLPSVNKNEDSRNRLRGRIEELEAELEMLRNERAEAYDSGKKAGFLPGELEGRGIVP